MNKTGFKELLEHAQARFGPRNLSPFVTAGSVAAALLTDAGNLYTGVCIDTASSLGMCAERSAIASMVTAGEQRILKLVTFCGPGKVAIPCGACRENLIQLDSANGDMEILAGLDPLRVVTLKELLPEWWGQRRMHT